MNPILRRALMAVAVLVAGALVVTGGQRIVERQRTANEINRLREELYRARVSSDRCQRSLSSSEAALLRLSETIDSLRGRVESYETVDGGVPAARYDEYLEVFESYNDSVSAWEERERRLRSAEAACRATIEGHNALSDSLQRVLAEAGVETG